MWDPFGTLQNTLWIGGGQWAGKSTQDADTITGIVADHFGPYLPVPAPGGNRAGNPLEPASLRPPGRPAARTGGTSKA